MAPLGKKSRKIKYWLRDDVLQLLCTLNLNIQPIHDMMVKQNVGRKSKIAFSVDLLSAKLAGECDTSRIEAKLKHLWDRCGDEEGAKVPDYLYTYGAFTMTLPGLEHMYPGMLNEIAANVRNTQEARLGISQKLSLTNDSSLRRSGRKKKADNDRDLEKDPVVCKCNFTHWIGTIHCDECASWQHLMCYYGDEDPERSKNSHLCQDCSPEHNDISSRGSLCDDVAGLNIETALWNFQPDENITRGADSAANAADLRIGPFGFPGEAEYFWGPLDVEIETVVRQSMTNVERMCPLLHNMGFSADQVLGLREEPKTSILASLTTALGPRYFQKVELLVSDASSSLRGPTRALTNLIAVFMTGVCFGQIAYAYTNFADIWLQMLVSCISKTNGYAIVRDLRRVSLQELQKQNHEPFQNWIMHEARSMTKTMINLLERLVSRDGSHSLAFETASNSSGSHIRDLFEKTFISLLRLKLSMIISESRYEIYHPRTGERTVEGFMVDEMGQKLDGGHIIDFCLIPAVLEYNMRTFDTEMPGAASFSIDDVFAILSDEQRSQARVITPATVVLE